jgi:hypothetical protein
LYNKSFVAFLLNINFFLETGLVGKINQRGDKLPFPYQDNHIPKSAPLAEKYQQLKQEYLSNQTDTLIAWRNFTNQKILLAIADDLIIRNALGAYVVNGIAHDYLFQDAIIQIAENQIQVCRWCETARNNIEIKYLQGRISWQKVINYIHRDGFTPDDNLSPDLSEI